MYCRRITRRIAVLWTPTFKAPFSSGSDSLRTGHNELCLSSLALELDVMLSSPDSPDALPASISALLKRDAQGLVAAVVQQYDSLEVLMLGWMDEEALRRTLTTGRVTFWSRSRNEYWRKGDTSGHFQYVKSVSIDCDGDALLVKVDQIGAACHTGTHTCFDDRELPALVGSPAT